MLQHGGYFGLSEAEFVGELIGLEASIGNEIVQPAEEALLSHAQYAGKHALIEHLVVLEARAEEAAHEADHLVVVAVEPSLQQGRVVLIDEEHHRGIVMAMQQLAQLQQGGPE